MIKKLSITTGILVLLFGLLSLLTPNKIIDKPEEQVLGGSKSQYQRINNKEFIERLKSGEREFKNIELNNLTNN